MMARTIIAPSQRKTGHLTLCQKPRNPIGLRSAPVTAMMVVPAMVAPAMMAAPAVMTVPTVMTAPVAMVVANFSGHAEIFRGCFRRRGCARIGKRESLRALGGRRDEQQSRDRKKAENFLHIVNPPERWAPH